MKKLKLLLTAVAALALTGTASALTNLTVYSDANDGFIEEFSAGGFQVHPETFGNWQITAGEWYGGYATIVLPFELPNVGPIANPFVAADFGVMLNPNSSPTNQIGDSIDLYAVRIDASPLILTNDQYHGAAFDPSATLIQEDFLVYDSPRGFVNSNNNVTSSSANLILLDYLNTAYANGANAGKYVFLRLSYAADFLQMPANYNINTREAGSQDEWPSLNLTVDESADFDGDGLPDFWEGLNGLDPFDDGSIDINNGAIGDPDEDGLENLGEFNAGTMAQVADTDGDELSDGDEVSNHSTDPTLADTDEDGLSDGAEVNTHSTDPLLKDSDIDGDDDYLEIWQRTDPNDALSNTSSDGLAVVDGVVDAAYGAAVAVQTVNTSGEDNNDELNAAYMMAKNGKLYLMLTGNLQTNWNKCEIFIDSTDAITTNVLETAGNSAAMDGMTFDTAFSPDYHLMLRGNSGFNQVNLDVANLGTKAISGLENVFGGSFEGTNYTGTGAANSVPIGIAFDNSNVAGVVSGITAANQVDAQAVTTGLELAIDFADLGVPTGLVRVAIMMADEPQTNLFNQVLPGIPPQGSLGPAVNVDFSAIDGDQFFVAFDGSVDTDGDGLPDVWEWTYGLDPTDDGSIDVNNGAIGDPDMDNLVNSNEYALGTNPQVEDSDGDELTDGDEVNIYGSNPLVWDTDGDGFSDGDEVNNIGTDPTLADTDSDGEDDFLEIWQGTSPTNSASSSAALGLAIVDGMLDSNYGAAAATQTVNTAWEDNLDELDAMYTYVQDDRLFVMITGNMNTNWNSVEIFIDSTDAVTSNVFEAQGEDNTGQMDGMVFDNGFSPDYHVNVRLGDYFGWNFNFDFYDLDAKTVSYQRPAFGGLDGGIDYMGPGDATGSGVAIGFTNSNTAGIIAGIGAANPADALAVTTGLEFSIALADLGNPYGEIRVMAMVTGSLSNDHDIVSNQILPGVPAPQGALGATSSLDFNVFAGDQFANIFTRPLPSPAIIASQLINGDTEMQLGVDGLIVGYDYMIQDSTDLQLGFSDVPGAGFTATSTNEVMTVPALGTEQFYRVSAP